MKVLDYDGLEYYNGLIENKYAPKNSPALTGTPTAPTPTAGDASTKIATTAFVNTKANDYLPLSGGTLTGQVNGVTPTAGDNSTKLATTAFVKNKADGYLPLSGGTMTGAITRNGEIIKNSVDTNYTRVCGGTSNSNGASLLLSGKSASSSPGWFHLIASNGINSPYLLGKPDGTLTWNGGNVLTDSTVGTYVSKDISQSVSLTANTGKNITSVSLSAGRWIVIGSAQFSSLTANKVYGIQIGTTSNNFAYSNSGSVANHSAHSGAMSLQTTHIFSLSSATTIYLTGFSNVNATVAAAVIQATRIV